MRFKIILEVTIFIYRKVSENVLGEKTLFLINIAITLNTLLNSVECHSIY